MATAAASIEPKERECAVCHEDFTDPKILPCAHLICRDCLVTWLKSDNEDQCPLCRCAIVHPIERASKSCEDIADAFPTDLAMAALVESARILSKDHVCCVCVNVVATSICLHCGDLLCQSCTNAHAKLSMSRHHKVESLLSLTPERLSASRPASCSAHTDRAPELFCPTHGVSVCLLCAMSDHQDCRKEKLEKKMDEARAILGDLVTTLSEGEKALERAINQLDQHLLNIDKITRATMADIDAACDRLESSVRTCRRRLKELAKAADADMKAEVHGGKAVLLEKRGKLTSHVRLAKRVQQTTPPSGVGEMTSTLQERVTGLDYSPTLPADVKSMTIRKLTIDSQAMTQIEKELDTLRQMKVTPVSLDFRFHTNHGKNIVLSDDQRSAERVRGDNDGIVLSSDPMMVNTLYEVQIVQKEKRDIQCRISPIGVTNEDPATFTLPEDSRDCLVTWLKADNEDQCPLCRCAIVDPKERASKSCEDIADALPADLAMAALVESARILSKDHVCCVCVNVAATSICLHCGDMLCQSCTNAHAKLSMSRHHKVESLTSLTPERLSASRPASCSAHTDRAPELFCPTHGVSVCLLCATSDHRECPKVVKLETKVKEAHAILGDLVTTLSEGEKALERAINQLDQHLLDVDKTTRATMADIDAACDRLESSVRTCRRRLKELAKDADADMKAEVHGGKAVLLEKRGKLTSHRRLAKRVQQTTPPSSVGEMTSTLQARVTGLDYSPTLPADVKRMTIRKLTIDPQAMTQIVKKLDTLGQMKVTPVSPEFRFHTNHGKNIVLSDDQRSAERVRGDNDGIVLSSDPMMVNTLYEVETRIGLTLWCLPKGCRVGVLVDDAGCLHLYKDGQDLGVAVSNVTHPCYAFFDVRDCLVTWLKSDNEDQCPLCRCAIVDPKERASKSCEDIADALPTDLAMASLVKSARILSKDHVCCVCVNVAATSICLHCGDMFCQSCTIVHGKMSATRHHKVESLTSLTPERLSASRPASCSAHTDRAPELFCPTHGVSVCLLCAMSDHQDCRKEKLETKVDEARAILGDLVTTLSEGEKAMERAINQLDKHLLDIDKTTRATMADIDAACDRLESSVRTCRRRLKELAKAADADMKAEVHGGKAVLLERRGKLTSHRRLAKRVQQTTPPSSVGEMTSTLQARVTGLDYSPTLPADVKRMTIRKLTIDPQAITQIEKKLDTLGQMKVTPVSPEFRFHTNHGKNIVLSDDQRSAERVRGDEGGIVLSSDPMMVNTLYEVQIVQKEKGHFLAFFPIGVTNEDPATLTLPEDSWNWKSAFVIHGRSVLAYGREWLNHA
nr:hypothetical protein BaRGS_025091 [Batillaria attramentaria]